MKRLNSYISLIFLSGIILFISACGTSEQSSDSTTEAGALAFSLVWEEPPASVIPSSGNAASALPGDCSGSGVDTVRVIIYDETGAELRSADFPCSDGQGTVDKISPGLRKVVIHGLDTNSKILYRAEVSGVTIESGKTTDMGTVTMNSAVPINVNASAGSQSVTISWNNVQYATSYNIYWYSSLDVNKKEILNVTLPYTHTNLTNGTTYYYVVTAVDEDGEESGESLEVSATPPDTTPPTVSVTNPNDKAIGVAVISPISVTFSEAMKGETITKITFTLSSTAGPVTGTVDYSNTTATFTPSDNLELITNYTATITAGATDIAGNPLTDYSWNFTTQDWTWGTAEPIETNTNSAYSPQIAMNASGNAIVVWEQHDGIEYNYIWGNRYAADTGWEMAKSISAIPARDPQIAMDSSGNAMTVWRLASGTIRIWANRYVAGKDWGKDELVVFDSGGSYNPQIAMDASGNAIAVWRHYDGTYYNIWANRYVAGEGWNSTLAEPIEINKGNANAPQIAMDANGNAIAVWYQYDGTYNRIYANLYIVDKGWDSAAAEPIEINKEDAYAPQIVMDANGNAIAVWTQFDGVYYNIYANRYVADTGWDPAAAEPIEINRGDASAPQIAMDVNGNAIAVWQQYDADGIRSIWANRYVAGTGWDDTALLIAADTGKASAPQIAMDSSGNAVVVWSRYDGAYYNIYANRYIAGQGWDDTAQLITTNEGNAFNAQITMNASGNAIAVWEQDDTDGTTVSIWANLFQ